jgi:hypothetical protein
MADDLADVERGLRERGLSVFRQRHRQLVVSRQHGPALPYAGNSFWLCRLGGDWYVCTWSPRYYRVPATSSVIDVAEAFVDVGSSAQTRVPPELSTRFGLVETDDDDFERLWGP